MSTLERAQAQAKVGAASVSGGPSARKDGPQDGRRRAPPPPTRRPPAHPPPARPQAAQAFLDKSDGRDKLLATVQYAAMFLAAGAPGDARRVQASVAAARKVFRVARPLEALAPLLHAPGLNAAKPLWLELLGKLKPALMALYFAGDHVVWAQQAGLLDKSRAGAVARAQRASLYCWVGGSLCTIVAEAAELAALTRRRAGEGEAEFAARQAAAAGEVRRRTTALVHALVQALLAVGLLELRPWKPRTVGALGVAASALNCYMLWPAAAPKGASAAPKAAVPAPAAPTPPRAKEL
jgi:hypothetical protein